MNTPNAVLKLLLLIPFVLLVLSYFAMYKLDPLTPSDTVRDVLLKTGPIYYLLVYVMLLGQPIYRFHYEGKRECGFETLYDFTEVTVLSLLMSSLGDISLVVNFFHLGMFFFGTAHGVRILGLCFLLKRSWGFESLSSCMLFSLRMWPNIIFSWLQETFYNIRQLRVMFHFTYGLLVLVAAVLMGVLSVFLPVSVVIYALLLLSMSMLQVNFCLVSPSQSSKLGAVGGIAFVISDCLLAHNRVQGTYSPMVMILYYLAQCALAVSAVWSPLHMKICVKISVLNTVYAYVILFVTFQRPEKP